LNKHWQGIDMRNPFDDMNTKTSLKCAEANAGKRALEQRELVLDTMNKGAFLDLDPSSREWLKVYGSNSHPAKVAPTVISSNKEFVKALPSLNCTTVKAAGGEIGTSGLSTIANLATPVANTFNEPFGNAETIVDPLKEYVIAEFPLGVGTDLAFLKPRFPQGDVEMGTTISGYLRFRFECGGPANASNAGYMNNGRIRVKVVDPQGATTLIILEQSCEQFNAASAAVSTAGSPTISNNLKTTTYPNFVAPGEVIQDGSSLVISVASIYEDNLMTLDTGQAVNMWGANTAVVIDGDASKIYIDTKRLVYY